MSASVHVTVYSYHGYTLHQSGGLWHVYESLVEVEPDARPGASPHPVFLDRYISLDLARQFVRHHSKGVSP